MGNYKILSLIQSILILICSLSIIDYGFSSYHIFDKQNLVINSLLFSNSTDLWNPIVFWGIMAFFVGILQVIKALTSDK